MTLKPSGRLRAAKALGSDPEADAAGENGRIGGSFATLADLVADLIGPIEIIPRDRLAAAKARAGVGSLAEALADEGHAQSDGIGRSLARRHGLPYIDLQDERPSGDAIEQIPLRALKRITAIPVSLQNGRLLVALADPSNILAVDELRLATKHHLDLAIAGRDDIVAELDRLERASEVYDTQAALEEFEVVSDDEGDDLEAEDGVSDAPLVRLVNSIIMQAASDGASDIHFEPQGDSLVVRTRVDGVLTEQQRIPKRMAAGVTTRLKVLAKLDIAERRKPQDGRISLNATRRRPAARHPRRDAADRRGRAGRDAPHRQVALDADARVARSLRDDARADLTDHPQADRRHPLDRPDRIREVDVALRGARADQPARDQHHDRRGPGRVPPHGDQPGPDQREGRPHLRVGAPLDPPLGSRRDHGRRDPRRRDGEDGDRVGADRATSCSRRCTRTTRRARSRASTRWASSRSSPAPPSARSSRSAWRARLCTNCCEMYVPTVDELLAARISPETAQAREGMVVYRKVGCPRCNRTGYKGRIGIFQLLIMNDELESLAAADASRDEIDRAAFANGMRSLWDDGIAKAAAGLTSVEELARVVSQ